MYIFLILHKPLSATETNIDVGETAHLRVVLLPRGGGGGGGGGGKQEFQFLPCEKLICCLFNFFLPFTSFQVLP